MNKEQIQNLAKEFCETEGLKEDHIIPQLYRGMKGTLTLDFALKKFLQSMIEKGEVVEVKPDDQLLIYTDEYFKQFGNTVSPYQAHMSGFLKGYVLGQKKQESSVSRAGKEVKSATQTVMELRDKRLIEVYRAQQMEDIVNIVQSFGDQFKSSPANTASPAKVISDEDIINRACDYEALTEIDKAGYIAGALWMREQLTKGS